MSKDLIMNIIGWVSTGLVLLSFLMASVMKLRIINIAGSVASVIYSIWLGAWATVLMNAALILINAYFIYKLTHNKNIYHVVETKEGDAHLAYFLDYYNKDIHTFFPDFKYEGKADVICFTYCENTPASVFMADKTEDGGLNVLLDYSTPAYRDYSAGKYIFEQLANLGYSKVCFNMKSEGHDKYLEKVGFVKEGDAYVKAL